MKSTIPVSRSIRLPRRADHLPRWSLDGFFTRRRRRLAVCTDVCAHRVFHQRPRIAADIRLEQFLDRRSDPVDDRAKVSRPRSFSACCWSFSAAVADRAALAVSEHDDQARAETLSSELDAADSRRRDHIARHTHHEQVTETLIKNQTSLRARENPSSPGSPRGAPVQPVSSLRRTALRVAPLLTSATKRAFPSHRRRSASRAGITAHPYMQRLLASKIARKHPDLLSR